MANNNNTASIPFWFLLVTVFVSGACVLIIELVGTRLLAPFFGSGIYTWSALIAVTLAALALGYAFGGSMADRAPEFNRLYLLCSTAGIWTLVTPLLAKTILPSLVLIDEMRLAVLLSSGVLFFPSLFLLGAIGPFTIRLLTTVVERVGSYSGLVFSISTIGSLLGALITGFVLIPNAGVATIFTLCGTALLVTAGAGFIIIKSIVPATVAAIIILVAVSGSGQQQPDGTNIKYIESLAGFYGHIDVVKKDNIKILMVDGVGQNYIIENSDYTTPYIEFISAIAGMKNNNTQATPTGLVIGLGAGQLSMQLQAMGYTTDTVEIDPNIVAIATRHFGLDVPADRLHIMDGRVFLMHTEKRYDYIVIDAFNAAQVAGHLLTREALSLAKRRLKHNGILAINLTSQPGNGDIASLQQTLKQVYPVVRVFSHQGSSRLASYVFIAAPKPVELASASAAGAFTSGTLEHFHASELSGLRSSVIYSDDYNPVGHQRRHIQLLWRKDMQDFLRTL